MKKWIPCLFLMVLLFVAVAAEAQCSVCTRTAQQMGEKPARGLNAGILYLAMTPFAVVGVIAFRWWKRNKNIADQ